MGGALSIALVVGCLAPHGVLSRLEDTVQIVSLHPEYLLDDIDTADMESTRIDVDTAAFASAFASNSRISVQLNEDLIVESDDVEYVFNEAGSPVGPEEIAVSGVDGPEPARFGSSQHVLRGNVAEVHSTGVGRSDRGISGDNGVMTLAMDSEGHLSGHVDAEGRRYTVKYDSENDVHRATIDKSADKQFDSDIDMPAELLEIPAQAQQAAGASLEATGEFKVGYIFNCLGSNGGLSDWEQTVWNSIVSGGVYQSFPQGHGLWTGPYHQGYCRQTWFSQSYYKNTAIYNLHHFVTNNDYWRTSHGLDMVIWINEMHDADFINVDKPAFFNSTGWTPHGADRTISTGVVHPDYAIDKYGIQHTLGHLFGFRYNRYNDNTNPHGPNHGCGIYQTNSNNCWYSVMALPFVCTAIPGKINYGRNWRYSYNTGWPATSPYYKHLDYYNGAYDYRADQYYYMPWIIQEVAKYA